MREQRAGRRGRGQRSFAWAFGLVTALGVAAPAWAQTPVPRFGMTSLAQRQVAALHLVLVEPPDAGHPGCRVTASFVNANGQVFNTRAGKPVRRTVTLQPQIAASFELRSEEILASTRTHMLIRAVLTPAAVPGGLGLRMPDRDCPDQERGRRNGAVGLRQGSDLSWQPAAAAAGRARPPFSERAPQPERGPSAFARRWFSPVRRSRVSSSRSRARPAAGCPSPRAFCSLP